MTAVKLRLSIGDTHDEEFGPFDLVLELDETTAAGATLRARTAAPLTASEAFDTTEELDVEINGRYVGRMRRKIRLEVIP